MTRRPWLLLAGTGVWIVFCAYVFSLTQHTGYIAALYWAVTTATTVGYGDVTSHGTGGMLLAIGTELTAIPALAATFALITSGHIKAHLDRHHDEQMAEIRKAR